MAKVVKPAGTIQLTRLDDGILEVKVAGLTPVIPHRWSEKSKRMMPGHPEKETVKVAKSIRKPKEEAEACLYRLDAKRIGMPATAFKAAMIGACRFFPDITMVEAKQMIFVEGEGKDQLVEVKGELDLREDTPRNSNGNCDLRYRYAILDWTATVSVRFVPTIITGSSIVSLLDAAGRGGIGDWRPSAPKSHTGTFGTWRVVE